MKQNIAEMIRIAQSKGMKVILQEMRIPTNYGPRYTRVFTAAYAQLGDEFNVPVIPFFLQDIALNKNLMQNDDLHPNKDA